jgi:hypothetical protein
MCDLSHKYMCDVSHKYLAHRVIGRAWFVQQGTWSPGMCGPLSTGVGPEGLMCVFEE